MFMLLSFYCDCRFNLGAVHKLCNAVGRGGVRESGSIYVRTLSLEGTFVLCILTSEHMLAHGKKQSKTS